MNETQQLLDDALNRFFSDTLDNDRRAAMEIQPWDAEWWDSINEQGFTQVMLSDAAGGVGGRWEDAFIVARACGYHAVPLPIPETNLAKYLLERASLDIPSGVPGFIPRCLTSEEICETQLVANVAGIPWARNADYFVGLSDAHQVCVLSMVNTAVTRACNLAREPRDTVIFEHTPIVAQNPIDKILPVDAVKWFGALLRSVQIAGAAAAIVELAVRYTSEREQFGRPLAKFQAIQHHLAQLAGEMASVDAITHSACHALDERGFQRNDRDARVEIAAAKCRASEAVEKLTRLGHQVHGAIGFTYEYHLHYLTRRLWSWRAESGGLSTWGGFLGRAACDQGGARLWHYLTA